MGNEDGAGVGASVGKKFPVNKNTGISKRLTGISPVNKLSLTSSKSRFPAAFNPSGSVPVNSFLSKDRVLSAVNPSKSVGIVPLNLFSPKDSVSSPSSCPS